MEQEGRTQMQNFKCKKVYSKNQNHSNAGEKETEELEDSLGDNQTKHYKNLGGNLETSKTRDSRIDKVVDYGGDGEDLAKTERKTGD